MSLVYRCYHGTGIRAIKLTEGLYTRNQYRDWTKRKRKLSSMQLTLSKNTNKEALQWNGQYDNTQWED